MNVSAPPRRASTRPAREFLAGARRARHAMMSVGNIERRDRLKRVDESARLLQAGAPDGVPDAVGGGEIVQRFSGGHLPGQRVDRAIGAIGQEHHPCLRAQLDMWRVRSSSLSRRVRSCFLMTSESYSSREKQPAMPVCSCAPMRSR